MFSSAHSKSHCKNVTGYVQRRGPSKLLSLFWRRSFCVLKGCTLYFYKSETEFNKNPENVDLIINLSLVFDISVADQLRFDIKMTTHNGSLHLRTRDSNSMDMWFQMLQQRWQPSQWMCPIAETSTTSKHNTVIDDTCNHRANTFNLKISKKGDCVKFSESRRLSASAKNIDMRPTLEKKYQSNRSQRPRPHSEHEGELISVQMSRSRSEPLKRNNKVNPLLPTNSNVSRVLSNLNRSHSSEPNTEADEDNPPQILTEAKVDPDQKHVKYDQATRASLRHRIVKNLSFGKTKNKPSKYTSKVAKKTENKADAEVNDVIATEKAVEKVTQANDWHPSHEPTSNRTSGLDHKEEITEEVTERVGDPPEESPQPSATDSKEEKKVSKEMVEEASNLAEHSNEEPSSVMGPMEYGSIVQIDFPRETLQKLQSFDNSEMIVVGDGVFEEGGFESHDDFLMEPNQRLDENEEENGDIKDSTPPPLPPKNIPRSPSLVYDLPRILKVHNETDRLKYCSQDTITQADQLPVN